MEKISRLLEGYNFTLVDIGAAGGVHKRWTGFGDLLNIVGFEPDEKEFVKLNNSSHELWFNIALADSPGVRKLHITKSQTNTSFLMPNYQLLNQLQWSPGSPVTDHDIIKDVDVQCDALDNLLGSRDLHPDFLKLDTQGSELDILKGAERAILDDLLIVEVEVEFAPIYQHQPLFADVDSFMRQRGYVLQDLGNLLYMKPRGLAGIGGAKGRIIAADALYVKDFSQDYSVLYESGERRVAAAIAGYAAYGYPELGIVLLQELVNRGCRIKNDSQLIDALRAIRPSRLRLPWLHTIAKKCGNIWFKHRKSEHSLWDVPLGN